MPSASMSNCITKNIAKPCSVTGCHRPRYKLCSRCRKHDDHVRRWGNHAGSCWRASLINSHLEAAELFAIWNRSHSATLTALAFIERLLEDGRRDYENDHVLSITSKTFGSLALESITPETILTRLLAVTMYLSHEMSERREPLRIEYQNNAGRYVLLSLAKPPSGGKGNLYARHVGGVLFSGLSKYLFAVLAHIETLERAEAEFQKQCNQPFRNTE